MKISKSGQTGTGQGLQAGELELINGFTRSRLEPEQLYCFSLLLCDNDIDRELERFEEDTLRELAGLFVGKSGIFDHSWRSENQIARIFSCAYESVPGRKTADGRDYACLKARAYMLRSEENAALIAQIEGGIKKETSVGCAVAENICSICGRSYGSPDCGHEKGRHYDGQLCHVILRGAVDAYEWSFVAVPAQKNAGIIKAFDPAKGLKGFVDSDSGRVFAGELEQLEKYSQLGREYMAELRAEVRRLGLICDRELYKSMDGAIELMDGPGLKEMKKALERKCAEKLPLQTQLPGLGGSLRFDSEQYSI